jgi:hypothetical protein
MTFDERDGDEEKEDDSEDVHWLLRLVSRSTQSNISQSNFELN